MDEQKAGAVAEEPAETPAEPAASRPRQDKRRGAPAAAATPRTLVGVMFERLEDFLLEVREHAAEVEGAVVRLTTREVPPDLEYGLRRVNVVASAVLGGQVYELSIDAGVHFGGQDEKQQEVERAADQARQAIARLCDETGLEIRSGRFMV